MNEAKLTKEVQELLNSLSPEQLNTFLEKKNQQKSESVLKEIDEVYEEMDKMDKDLSELKEKYKNLSGESYNKVEQRQKEEIKKKVYEAWKNNPNADLSKVAEGVSSLTIKAWIKKWESGEGLPK